MVIAAPRPATALVEVEIPAGTERASLGTSVEYLEDVAGAWTIDDVASPAFQGRFVPIPGQGFNAGPSGPRLDTAELR